MKTNRVSSLSKDDKKEILGQCGKKWRIVVEKLIYHRREYSIRDMASELHKEKKIPEPETFRVAYVVINAINNTLIKHGSKFRIGKDFRTGTMWINII